MTEVLELERPAPDFIPGAFPEMAAELYHAIRALSSGGARALRRSPAHFQDVLVNRPAPTAQMELGTVIHAGVLEPDRLRQVYAVAPTVDKRTNAGKAELAAFEAANAGKILLTPKEEKNALGAIAAVLAHPSARRLLDGATTELSLFWIDGKYKVPCKARFDAINHGLGIDLKSTQDASRDAFARSVVNFEYHAQAAHYMSGAEHALHETPRGFVIIAVETAPPYCVACYVLPSNAILMGQHLTAIALERYASGLATGVWPGYPDTIELLELPRWALKFAA